MAGSGVNEAMYYHERLVGDDPNLFRLVRSSNCYLCGPHLRKFNPGLAAHPGTDYLVIYAFVDRWLVTLFMASPVQVGREHSQGRASSTLGFYPTLAFTPRTTTCSDGSDAPSGLSAKRIS